MIARPPGTGEVPGSLAGPDRGALEVDKEMQGTPSSQSTYLCSLSQRRLNEGINDRNPPNTPYVTSVIQQSFPIHPGQAQRLTDLRLTDALPAFPITFRKCEVPGNLNTKLFVGQLSHLTPT